MEFVANIDPPRWTRVEEKSLAVHRLIGRGMLTVPQQIDVHKYLGFAYVALDEQQLALEAFTRAIALQPTLKGVRERQAELQAIEAEHLLPDLLKRAGLLPRPVV